MKTPTRRQRFIAHDGPYWTWVPAGTLCFELVVLRASGFSLDALGDLRVLPWMMGVAAIAFPVGWLLSTLVGWPVLGSIYLDQEIRNGGPFRMGDWVQILAGPHRGRVGRVYSTWQGNTLRVELGSREKRDFSDVFCPSSLLREDEPGDANASDTAGEPP